ncbi:hypothetical protein FO059_18145 (plasmid) [Tomitella fengzijianii]|uniref:Uncharacterized protein n=1 Tax=Tomitella fengzijianii TaxID=2597660 RepID=A0A516X8X6_9ACTN|nr:hypothetical protein [Tomitella fengzijianii]QDQ99517.1 hypothetical protein FO059_18145 [Tomitella fengzijianii]
MASTAQRAAARTRAREKMTEHLAARREREKQLQDDLAAFFKTEDKLATARERRDIAYRRADARYDRDTAAVYQRRAELVAAMRTTGQTVADIAALTGLPAAEVRELHRAAGTQREQTAKKTPAPAAADTGGPASTGNSRPAGGHDESDGPREAAAL